MERTLLALSIAVYLASLFPDSFCIGDSCSDWPGWGILLIGWMAVLFSPANATWIANPLVFASWFALFLRFRRLSLALAGVACAVALSFLLFDEVQSSEGGRLRPITGTALGYWLWVVSMALAGLAAGAGLWRQGKSSGGGQGASAPPTPPAPPA